MNDFPLGNFLENWVKSITGEVDLTSIGQTYTTS